MPSLRDYDDLKRDIENHIEASTQGFLNQLEESKSEDDAEKIGVVKYFPSEHLEGFLKSPRLVVSNTPGYTWGDGVYVAPLQFPKSSMMYGRVGVLGWYDTREKRVYDAIEYQGLSLYQEWITHHILLYNMLTTTVHSQVVNRMLRNKFKKEFNIQVIAFRPDEKAFGMRDGQKWHFTDFDRDIWLTITDKNALDMSKLHFSDEIEGCRWIAIVANEFIKESLHRKATLPIHEQYEYWDMKGNLLTSDSALSDDEISDIYRKLYKMDVDGSKSTIMGILP